MLCVCYQSPRWNKPYLDEWLGLFTSFLETTSCHEKIIIIGDFNFPDLTWNSELVPVAIRDISSGSAEFRELILDFYFEQMNMFPTRLNNILDLVFTNSPEIVTNLSCVPRRTMGLFRRRLITKTFLTFSRTSKRRK